MSKFLRALLSFLKLLLVISKKLSKNLKFITIRIIPVELVVILQKEY